MTQKVGQVTWQEQMGGKTFSKDEWLSIKDSGVIRIFSAPFQYYVHQFKNESDPGFGDRVMCSAPTHKVCPLCAMENRPKRRWYLGVIDRKTQTPKIWDIGAGVYEKLQGLVNKERYGALSRYDIEITVNKKASSPANYYELLPFNPEPLSAADLKIVEAFDLESLTRRCAPPSPETVLPRLNARREKRGLAPVVAIAGLTPPETTEVPAAQTMGKVDLADDEFKFDQAE